MSDPVFVLLKEGLGWVEEKYLWDTLGAVVKNYLSPGAGAVPKDTLRFSQGLDEITLDNFWLTKEQGERKEKVFSLPGWFEIRGQKQNLQRLKLRGKRIHVKRLRDPEDFWELMNSVEPEILLKVQDWRKERKNILGHPKGKAFWVTGVLLCQSVYIAASTADARELNLRGEINLGTCAELAIQAGLACPLPVDLSALPSVVGERSKVTANSQCYGGNAKGTYIFGLQLQEVVVSGKKDAEKLSTREARLKLDWRRQLDDSDSDDNSAQLETVELDEETWNFMLEEEVEEVPST
ncbi:MAG: hypothetical protein GOMPHAMPRED_004841 [Gomphillus americanus]|uniref:Uncharacterized protein n=1 Tax=Gomphillus americanus TaxID=1940652 RepID=A0A8H3EGA8_9LECA|nr:MAG: hypothetical protein GOMPHAMPRED_004841 [Gomphillus americanus]